MTTEEKPVSHHYQLPTRMNIEDKLINIGPFSLTLRQGFVLTIGGCVAVNIWRWLGVLMPFGASGLVIRIALTSIPLLLTLMVAIIRVTDRYLEDWAIVLVRYAGLPKLYEWQHLPVALRRLPSSHRPKRLKRKKGQGFMIEEESEVR